MIYQVDSNRPYLQSIANFIIKSYDDLHSLHIIVPSSTVCTFLQNAFIEINSDVATILPCITPINSLANDSKLFYKMEGNRANPMSYLEQKLLLIEVLLQQCSSRSPMMCVNELEAANLADELLSLFREIYVSDISIESLYKIIDADVAAHWEEVSSFIVETYNVFYDLLKDRGRIDDISLLHQLLDLEMECQKNADNVILVGLFSRDKKIQQFIKWVANSSGGVVILPPVESIYLSNHIDHSSPFFYHRQVLDFCECKLQSLPYAVSPYSKHHDIALGQDNIQIDSQHIHYVEADNIASEIDFVCRFAISSSKEAVVIVTENDDLVRQYELYFKRYNKEVNNLLGKSIYYSKEAQFILLVADVVYTRDVQKFIALLKTSYLISDIVYQFEIEIIIAKKITSFVQMIDEVNKSTSEVLRNWFFLILESLKSFENIIEHSNSFIEILRANIEVTIKLAPKSFENDAGIALLDIVNEMLRSSSQLSLERDGEYRMILRNLLLNTKYFVSNNSNIIITNPRDAIFLDVPNIIISDCNEGSFPSKKHHSPWMSNKMRQIVGLESDAERAGKNYYEFYVLLNKQNIYITRSITSNSKQNLPSKFLLTLLLAIEKANKMYEVKSIYRLEELSANNNISSEASVSLHYIPFPASISATNIELLIRNPYGFYAKNILKLRKLRDVNEDTSLADFGNIVHETIHKYTLSYSNLLNDKKSLFVQCAKEVLQKYVHDIKSQNWLIKLEQIADNFIVFDDKRREKGSLIYSEIYGETSFLINGRSIKVTAVADRIELTNDGIFRILDFKTGALPTKQDVISGISPQLIIESIILADGGFKNLPSGVSDKLIYVKINSAGQFVEQVIDFTAAELSHHRIGLIGLLEYYTSPEAVFCDMPSIKHAPQYNDYLHLARSS